MRTRDKCNLYEYAESSPDLFLNLEKSRAAERTIQNLTKYEKSKS